MRTLKAGTLYFALVFAVGFALGTVRVLWIVPRVGVRTAELMETPIMLVVTIFAARWVVQRMALPSTVRHRLGTGLIALGLLLIAELAVVLCIQRMTLRQYIAGRDPVAGTAYLVMLAVFAVMPVVVGRA